LFLLRLARDAEDRWNQMAMDQTVEGTSPVAPLVTAKNHWRCIATNLVSRRCWQKIAVHARSTITARRDGFKFQIMEDYGAMQDMALQRMVIDLKSKSLKISVGPREDGASTRRSGFNHLRKKLAPRVLTNSANHHATSATMEWHTFTQVVMSDGPSARFSSGVGSASDRLRSTNFRQLASWARGAGRQRDAKHGQGWG
jgi:hypothetical protein